MIKFLFAVALLGSMNAFAEHRMEDTFPSMKVTTKDEMRMQFGVNSGVNAPRGDNPTTSELGATMAFEPVTSIGLGVDVSTSRFQSADDQAYERITALARATYNLAGDIPIINGMYIGAGAGPVWMKNQNEWAFAPLAGFDIPLTNKTHNYLSIGLNEKFLSVTNAPDSWITTGALKYWF